MDQVFMHRYDDEFLAGIAAKQLRIAVDRGSGKALGYHERAWCARDDAGGAWKCASGRVRPTSRCRWCTGWSSSKKGRS